MFEYVPDDRWNIAIAMRRGETQLKEHVDRALEKMVQRGVVANALHGYHMPYFAPFESLQDGKSASIDNRPESSKAPTQFAAQSRPVERGLEPQMSRRQVSRRGYDGLEKIRSSGSIVVGLDQNNLPFSTAHPHPAGLDYEIAQLLADQLGVSLEIYWAYSSHDSYPSKLADKKLCDVIMGVMPDDRFAKRVAFSDPYYFANYVYAVSAEYNAADVDKVLGHQAVALESGVAVNGFAGQELQRYSSVEAILSDVAGKRVPVGYVISCRAQWLAAQRWPDQIRFVSPRSSVDRFPICIALRRHEPVLKDAIDAALKKLRSSGRLQSVFARWHVPLDASAVE